MNESDLAKCRAAFEVIAPVHAICIDRFTKRPDEYKFAHTAFLWALYQDAWKKAIAR